MRPPQAREPAIVEANTEEETLFGTPDAGVTEPVPPGVARPASRGPDRFASEPRAPEPSASEPTGTEPPAPERSAHGADAPGPDAPEPPAPERPEANEANEAPASDAEDAGPRSEPAPALGGLEETRELLRQGEVLLIVPSEVFLHFYPASPEQVINAVISAGFEQVHFETLGEELVALEYLRLWLENPEKKTWIRSTSPLVVEYCRARHPELLPYLAPIVPPATALARWMRFHGEDRPLVYAGLDVPEVNGSAQFAAALSFHELETLLEERGAPPEKQPMFLRYMPPERRRYLSAAGGLPLAMLDQERASSRTFRKLRGLHTLAAVSRMVRNSGGNLGFIDVLAFDGMLEHPALGPPDELYWRREILELAEPERAESPVIDRPPGLDLSVRYGDRPTELPTQEVSEIERALSRVAEEANGVLWKREARDFAGYLSLAESLVRSRPDLALGLLYMSRTFYRAVRDATHDALTDLYSYRALVERTHEELGQANRAGQNLAMLFVDLDDFKEINDRFGHPTGNEVLRRVARVLERSIRSTDIAGRFGGDEFVLLLIDADFEGALRVAEQVRREIGELRVEVDGEEARTTASVGIAFHPGSEDSLVNADDLFAEADAALYIAKAHGGDRVHPVVREGTS